MPELPEVETVVRSLKPNLIGRKIESVGIPNNYLKVLENGSKIKYQKFLEHKTIKDVLRRGKYIILKLNEGFLLIHLRMTGQIHLNIDNVKNLKYVSFYLKFTNDSELFFQDTRKFGRIYICSSLDWLEMKFGIEPLSKSFTKDYLYYRLKKSKRMMKSLLLDQQFIAGLGNIYTDEALWYSGIHPKAISNKVSKNKATKLTNAIKEILSKAISYNGTTIINFSYGVNKNGNFSKELKVFGKDNSPCPNCNKLIIKKFISQRGTHFCTKCQKI